MFDQSRLLTGSGRLYSLLLLAYPARFRRAYGQEMAQVFRDDIRATFRESGVPGLIGLWFLVVLDLFKTALAEHIWEVFHMPMEKLIRLSGPAAVLAGALWAFVWVSDLDLRGAWLMAGVVILAALLSAFGLLGVPAVIPSRMPARLGQVVALIGLAIFGVLGVFLLSTETGGELAWTIFVLGFGLLFLGTAALGVSALGAGAPRLVALALLGMALCQLAIWVSGEENPTLELLLGIGYGLSWVALGAGLWLARQDTPDAPLPA